MLRLVYVARYTKIQIKCNILNVQKIAISGNSVVPGVPDITLLLYSHRIVSEVGCCYISCPSLYFLTSYSQIKIQ